MAKVSREATVKKANQEVLAVSVAVLAEEAKISKGREAKGEAVGQEGHHQEEEDADHREWAAAVHKTIHKKVDLAGLAEDRVEDLVAIVNAVTTMVAVLAVLGAATMDLVALDRNNKADLHHPGNENCKAIQERN